MSDMNDNSQNESQSPIGHWLGLVSVSDSDSQSHSFNQSYIQLFSQPVWRSLTESLTHIGSFTHHASPVDAITAIGS